MDSLRQHPDAAERLRETLRGGLAVTADMERLLIHMYATGVADTLDALGIDADDLPQGDGAVAWTA